MPYNNNITPGAPPLLWSDVNEAFTKINENFDILAASVGLGGLLDFNTLDTNLSPTDDETYTVGSSSKKWKEVHVSGYSDVPGKEDNGLWIGNAQVQGVASHINLPANSTIDGNLIIDPSKTFFKSIQVDNNLNLEATTFGATVNLLSGDGIGLAVDSGAESITIENTGILTVTPSTGILSTTVAGVATISNDGVLNFSNPTTLPALADNVGANATGRVLGTGISVSAVKGGNINITNTGVIRVRSETASLVVSYDTATGIVSLTNLAPAGNSFRYVSVDGSITGNIEANSANGILNFASGRGISLSKNTISDTVTIDVTPKLDITGSVFADNSTLLVDGISGTIPAEVLVGTFTGTLIGNSTGYHTGDIKGSVFGDDSSKIVDAVENKVYATFFGNITGNVTGNVSGNLTGNVTGNADTATISSKLDITNTNGLTTVYYPTFVENRTTGQIVRADIDLTYRTDTNTLTVPNVAGNLTGDVVGNTTGYHTGDVKGSVFGDDSSKIVDAVEGRIYARSIEATSFIQSPVYNTTAARDLALPSPTAGMIVFVTTGTTFYGYTGAAWVALN